MRVALITGASKGIGYATALSLAEAKVAVAIHYNSGAEKALALMEQINKAGGRAFAVQGDLTDSAAPKRIVKEVEQNLGGVDILINNAGIFTEASLLEMTEQIWEESFAVNLTSVFRLTQACIPHMIKNNWGRIINISSQAAKAGSKRHSHYAATKAGLIGFNNSIAKELGKNSITANIILPGRIDTEILGDPSVEQLQEWISRTPLMRLGTVEEVAGLIKFIASDGASYITGATLNVTGGLL